MPSLAELSELSAVQVEAVQTGQFWVSTASLLSCGLVLCSWALCKDLRRFAFNLITLLALCQCGASSTYVFFIDPAPSSPGCLAQSLLGQVTNKPRFSLGFLATLTPRLPLKHLPIMLRPSPHAHPRPNHPSTH